MSIIDYDGNLINQTPNNTLLAGAVFTVQDLKADLSGILHGTTLNQITGIDNLIYRSGRQLLMDIDPQETKRVLQLSQVFRDVYEYACPFDLKGNKVIDIFSQTNRYPGDIMTQEYNRDFDTQKRFSLLQNFTIKINSAVKTIRINNPKLTAGIVLNMADTLTGNGTWIAGGNASSLAVDNIYFADGAASLKFNLFVGGGTGYLENSTMNSLDLTEHDNLSNIFLYAYFPTGTDFTQVDLRWGTDASNYWTNSATATQDGLSFYNGWNLLYFNWPTATKVGNPDSSNIKYLRVTYTYTALAEVGVRLNNVVSNLGSIMNIEYYSKYLFRDGTTWAFQEKVTDDSNIINLDTESYNLLVAKAAIYCAQQAQGVSSLMFDNSFWQQEYANGINRYKAMYKSEVQKPQSVYYQQPKPGFQKYWNRRNY
jgi:hypothetical protein